VLRLPEIWDSLHETEKKLIENKLVFRERRNLLIAPRDELYLEPKTGKAQEILPSLLTEEAAQRYLLWAKSSKAFLSADQLSAQNILKMFARENPRRATNNQAATVSATSGFLSVCAWVSKVWARWPSIPT
jgi:hypothetical protein